MSMTMVSRRVVGFSKSKPKSRPAPPPQKASDAMVGERAKPYAPLVVAHPPQPRSWWQKALKPTAMSLGALACCGFVYVVATSAPARSYERQVDTAQSAAGATSPSMGRGARTSAYPGGGAPTEDVVLSKRSTPTDESFLATAYVRRKVSLPNISGNCVVSGSGSRDVGACLRRQMGSS